MHTNDRLLTENDAASYLAISPITLRRWRWLQIPDTPRWIKLGNRTIRYPVSELQQYIAARLEGPGITTGGGGDHE